MDFSTAGLKDGIVKALKVAGWIAASGAVAALSAALTNVQVQNDQVIAVMAVLVANAALAGAHKWLTTHAPAK